MTADDPLREDPIFTDVFSLPPKRYDKLEVVRDLDVRVVSRYADHSGVTLLVELPPGWRAVERAAEGALEAFVVAGELMVDGERFSSGGYAAIPRGSGPVELASTGGRVLLFWSAGIEIAPVRMSVWDEPWELTRLEGFPVGGMHKSMREPDEMASTHAGGRDGFLRLVMCAPGWVSEDKEKHRCWEENIVLRGDMLMPMEGRGVLTPGINLANPRDYWHGPMATKGGTLFVVHCDTPMDVVYRPEPGSEAVLREYLESAPW